MREITDFNVKDRQPLASPDRVNGDGREGGNRALVRDFEDWSGRNHLLLNVTKTRKMVTDFRKKRIAPQPPSILAAIIQVMEDFKYPGVHMDSRLN